MQYVQSKTLSAIHSFAGFFVFLISATTNPNYKSAFKTQHNPVQKYPGYEYDYQVHVRFKAGKKVMSSHILNPGQKAK